ncbi:hypothetical protein [Nevskia sp.]|uniref:hypothetical protein n=1 Tax=Nevskia sp. TaxID=1929292 RepID=UPI003F71B79F
MRTHGARIIRTGIASLVTALAALTTSGPAKAYHFFEADAGGGCRWAAVGPGNVDYRVDGSSTPDIAATVLAEALAAKSQWNDVASAEDVFGNFTTVAIDYTGDNFGTAWGIGTLSGASDGQNEVVFDEDGSAMAVIGLDPSDVNGFGPSREVVSGGSCTITDAFLLLNGTRTNYHRPSTAVHELGHTIGFAHSSVGQFNSLNSTAFNGGFGSPSDALTPININNVPTMHPFSIAGTARATIEDDDRAAISRRYPNAAFSTTLGTIVGNVRRCSNDAPVAGVNVRAINTATGAQVSRYTAFDSNTTGRFEISVPPGSYHVVVEEMGHNGFVADRMAIKTATDQGFPFEYYGPTAEAELACSEDDSEAPLAVPVSAGSTSDVQIRLNDGVRLAFVVDDTGSMSNEISAVRQILTNIIDNRIAAGGPFPRTAVVTFKDNVTRRVVSDVPSKIQAVVNTLSAGGGSDCPESSNAALMTAGRILANGGRAILFTDADSRPDGPSRGSVVSYYRSRSLTMSTLLSATCSEEFPSARAAVTSGTGTRKAERAGQHEGSVSLRPWAPETIVARALTPRRPAGVHFAEEYPEPEMLGRESAFTTNSGISQFTGGVFVATPRPISADDRTRYINAGTSIGLGSVTSTVATLAPSAVPAGATAVLDVLGASTNFTSSSTVSFANPSLTVVSREVLSPRLIRTRITVAADTVPGFFDVSVATPLGTATEVANGIGALQVTAPVSGGEIATLSPSSAARGSSRDVTIFGAGTAFTADSVVQFLRNGSVTPNITVNSRTLVSPTELRVNVTIADAAVTSFYDVAVDSITEARGFTVTEVAPVVPTIVSLTPNASARGVTGLPVTLVGQNVSFTDASVVSFGDGITVTGTTLVDATTLTATISVAADAAPGFRDVTVNTAGVTAAILSGFQVTVPPADIVSVTPGSGSRGASGLAVTIVGENVAFSADSVVSFGDGITVTGTSRLNPTTLVATLSIAADAAVGPRNVSVTTDGLTLVESNGFTVSNAAITGLAPDSAQAGSRGVTLTISGSGFGSPAAVAFSGTGITVRSVTVDSATRITAVIDLDRNAAVGLRDVTVTVSGVSAQFGFRVLQRRSGGAAGLVLVLGLGVMAGLRRRSRRR